MKNYPKVNNYAMRLILSLIILLNFLAANGQTTTLLTNPSNTWYESGGFGFWPFSTQSIHKKFYFNGDTIINSNSYNKLYIHQIDTIFENGFGSSNPDSILVYGGIGYMAAFRQDSTKVYFVLNDSISESLFCDFNMVVGDTLKFIYNDNHNIVDSINIIPFGSETIKEFKLDNGRSFYECIGNELGLFHGFGIGIEGGVYLSCFEQGDISFSSNFFGGFSSNCSEAFITNVGEKLKNNFTAKIYPNPIDEILNININQQGNYNLKIYNSVGQLITQSTLGLGTTTINLQSKNVSAGLYFVEISNEQQQRLKVEKVVVAEE